MFLVEEVMKTNVIGMMHHQMMMQKSLRCDACTWFAAENKWIGMTSVQSQGSSNQDENQVDEYVIMSERALLWVPMGYQPFSAMHAYR